MTPILPENRDRYPLFWKALSFRIRFDRAGGRCECAGECDLHSGQRCSAVHGQPLGGGGKVVLTTAHLNHVVEDVRDENLKAMCQRCHLRYDRAHHAASRARRST